MNTTMIMTVEKVCAIWYADIGGIVHILYSEAVLSYKTHNLCLTIDKALFCQIDISHCWG